MAKLTHLTDAGAVRMVDVSDKPVTDRLAEAAGEIRMAPGTLQLVREGQVRKGNVLETARLAGIMAAKRTAEWIPLCHSLPLSGVDVTFDVEEDRILARASVRVTGRTGVEMEALTAVSASLLTIYDMCKAVDRSMVMGDIRLLRKSGGRSGTYVAGESDPQGTGDSRT